MHRPWRYWCGARKLKVQIDGTQVPGIKNNAVQEYAVAPGAHMVQVTVDWFASEPFSVTIAEGELIRLTALVPDVFSLKGFWDSCVGSLFWPKELLMLSRTQEWLPSKSPPRGRAIMIVVVSRITRPRRQGAVSRASRLGRASYPNRRKPSW